MIKKGASFIISFTECNTGTTQQLPFGVNAMIELKNITTSSVITDTLPRQKHNPLGAIIVGRRCYVV
jgi:hypothetical protein